MDNNRKKALSAALGQIEKQFGKGAIMRMGDSTDTRDIDVISTGSLGLDVALGKPPIPRASRSSPSRPRRRPPHGVVSALANVHHRRTHTM